MKDSDPPMRLVIAIQLDCGDMQVEAIVGRKIAEGLVDRGYRKVELIAADVVYDSTYCEKVIPTETGMNLPIMTSTTPFIH